MKKSPRTPTKKPKATDLPTSFRLPKALKDELLALARQNFRSMNAEVVYRLELSLTNFGPQAHEENGKERSA